MLVGGRSGKGTTDNNDLAAEQNPLPQPVMFASGLVALAGVIREVRICAARVLNGRECGRKGTGWFDYTIHAHLNRHPLQWALQSRNGIKRVVR